MILLTRLNGPVFALNPDLLERADCTPDTVLTLVDGTKYLVAESLPDVIALVRQYRASVVADAQQLTGHPAGTGRGAERVNRGGDSAQRGAERPGARAADLTLERAGQRTVERRGQRTVERRGQRPAEGGSAGAAPAQATAASKVAPGPTATSATNVVQLPRRER